MSLVRMQSIAKCIRITNLSAIPVRSVASRHFRQSGKMTIRSMSTTDGKNKADQAEPDDSGFNIFEQLKAQQQGKGSQSFEEESELDEKEKERLKRQQASAEKEINERQARTFGVGTISMILGLVGMYAYLGIPGSEEESPQEESSYLTAHHGRVMKALSDYYHYWSNPPTSKILPDPLPVPYQRPLTLCIELNDSLVHLVWDKSLGWRVATRPGVKQFLANLSRYYEIVIYTTQPGYLAEPVNAALDPYQYAMYRLYRDHTKLVDGKYIKDISQLNRDPRKVIMVDVNPEAYSLQPENGLHLKSWKGEAGDKELLRLETFLEELYLLMSMMGAEDIRPFLNVVQKLNANDPPAAWETHKQRLREEFDKVQGAQNRDNVGPRGFLSSLMGGAAAKKQKPRNIIDLLETVAKEEREAFAKEQEQNRAQLLEMQKQHEEAIRKQMEDNKNKKLKLVDYLMGAGQPEVPGQQPKAA